ENVGVERALRSRRLDPCKSALDPVNRCPVGRGGCRLRHANGIGTLYPGRNPRLLTRAPARPIGTPHSIRRGQARCGPGIRGPAVTVSFSDRANAIRALAMDAVEAANSGHPGMPMGMADVATVLFSDYLK